MLKDVLKEFRSDGKRAHRIAADLVELADKNGIAPNSVPKFADLMKSKKLKPADITDEVLTTAKLIERMDWSQTMAQVDRINDARRPKPKASPLVKTLHRILTTQRVPLTERGAFKARKALVAVGIDMDDITDALMDKVQTYQNQLMGG